jgi:sortase A
MKTCAFIKHVRPVMAAFVLYATFGSAMPAFSLAPHAAARTMRAQVQPEIPTRIVIERLRVDAAIEPVGPSNKLVGKGAVEWDAPKNRNVGWHDYSGRLSDGMNIVLNGHNNIYGGVFRKLYTLKPGDVVRLSAASVERSYAVVEVRRVLERGQPLAVRMKNAEAIQPMQDDRLTLISCWPETGNSHRIIVIARPIP